MRKSTNLEMLAILIFGACACVFLLTSCGTKQIVAKNCEEYKGGYWLCDELD